MVERGRIVGRCGEKRRGSLSREFRGNLFSRSYSSLNSESSTPGRPARRSREGPVPTSGGPFTRRRAPVPPSRTKDYFLNFSTDHDTANLLSIRVVRSEILPSKLSLRRGQAER